MPTMQKTIGARGASMSLLAACGVLACTTYGCATVFHGTQTIVPVTSEPPGLQVLVDGIPVATTPTELAIRSDQSHLVTIRSPFVGIPDRTAMLSPAILGGYIVLDVLTGLVGIVVDALTGAWNELQPSRIDAVFTTQPTSSMYIVPQYGSIPAAPDTYAPPATAPSPSPATPPASGGGESSNGVPVIEAPR